MTQEMEAAVVARCQDCNKGYRVPDPERIYRCKSCGGKVRVTQRRETVACGECGAENDVDSSVCFECETVLEGHGYDADFASLDARHEANEVLRRAYGWMTAVTWLYRIGALAFLGMTVVAVGALAAAEVPVEPGFLVVGLATALTVVMFIGAFQILFRPFVWALTVAVLATAVSVVHLVGPNPLGLAFYWSLAWALLFWLAAIPSWTFRRLIAEHTDLYVLHHASRATRRSVEGKSARERHERLLAAMAQAGQRAWKVSIAGALVLIAAAAFGSYSVYANLRPAEFVDARTTFEGAWNGQGIPAALLVFPAKAREEKAAWIENVLLGHGFEDPPALAAGVETPGEEEVDVVYDLEGVPLTARWQLVNLSWVLYDVLLPTPPLEPVLERFRAAWESSDARAVASFFADQYVERMQESITSSTERRGWPPYPAIVSHTVQQGDGGETVVLWNVGEGEVTTKWVSFSDGTWGLKGIQFPKRR